MARSANEEGSRVDSAEAVGLTQADMDAIKDACRPNRPVKLDSLDFPNGCVLYRTPFGDVVRDDERWVHVER